MDTIQLGPIMLRWDYIAFFAAGVAGLFMIGLKLKAIEAGRQAIMDILINGLLVVLLFWKFGSVLFHPAVLWENPLGLLLTSGTYNGGIIGIVIAIIYTLFKLRKGNITPFLLLDLLPFGILTLNAVKSLFYWQYGKLTNLPWGIHLEQPAYRYHPLNIYILLLSSTLLLWFWQRRDVFGRGKIFQVFLIYYSMGLLLISFFEQQDMISMYLSAKQWLYLIAAITGLLCSRLFSIPRLLHDNNNHGAE